MKHQIFWTYCAATIATLTVMVGTATAALAQQGPVTVTGQRAVDVGLSTLVPYRDLNLASIRGERSLNQRVRTAARLVCSPAAGGVTLSAIRAHSLCLDFALDGARPQMTLAVQRAREIAATGISSILPVAIAIVAPR